MALWMKASNERKSLSIGVGREGVTMSHQIDMGVYYVSSDRGQEAHVSSERSVGICPPVVATTQNSEKSAQVLLSVS